MFQVYFTNFGYFAQRSYPTVEDAIAFGKLVCFEFAVYRATGQLVATWSPIGGTRIEV